VNLKRFFSPSMAVAGTALFVALGGGSYAAAHTGGSQHHQQHYVPAKRVATSGGVKFLTAGETRRLGKVGHFTFSATCSKVDGDNQVSFDVVADTTAALDGNAPAGAGNPVNIHTNSDKLDGKGMGEFDQVGSASDSTELAADGQEVDVFYNDGVNWPAVGASQAHDCFAGFSGIRR
jgi:hypothetical protein